jgi:3-dehydrosphinganine reductase
VQLAGVHALVTGGSQGIGFETARILAGRGARLSIVARRPEPLAAAATAVGGTTRWRVADVTDPDATDGAIAELVGEHGPVDLLVAAAGAAHPGYFEQLDLSVFRDQMDLNFFGTLHAVRAVLPAMLDRGAGRVVAVSSGAALVGVFGYGAYAPAKHAVRGLMDALHAEYAHRGVTTATAFPPDTLTPGLDAENRIKPPETAAVSAGIRPRTAVAVAEAVVRGVERDRRVITADAASAALAKGGAAMSAIADRQMAATLRKHLGRR